MLGSIVKGISGFYYVAADDGNVYECKARGVFKKRGLTPLAGDQVEISVLPTGEGWVEKILPRTNSFERPPVANVETVIIVSAAHSPEPNFDVLDRFCVAGEVSGAKIIICVNKIDIADESELNCFSERYKDVYPLFFVSARTGQGIEELKSAIQGQKAALAGPSGAGKSSLINALLGEEKSQTGEISERLLRGKNTTRHSELFKGDDFFLFDTPGFTSFDIAELEANELENCFPEFRPYLGLCRFNDCMHVSEPDCAVRNAVSEGKINENRYNSYKEMYLAIKERIKY